MKKFIWLGTLSVIMLSAATSYPQSLKDLAAKAKQKLKDAANAATGQGTSNGAAPAGQGAPTTASASGQVPATVKAVPNYRFCTAARGSAQLLVSDVFRWGDGTYNFASTQELTSQWRKFVAEHYKVNSGYCEDQYNEAGVAKRKSDIEAAFSGSSTLPQIETNWTPAGVPANSTGLGPQAETPANENSSASGAGQIAPRNLKNYTFCQAGSGRNQLYFSEVFPWGDGKYNVDNSQKLFDQWRKFVAERYNAENAKCQAIDRFDEQGARAKKAETKKALSSFAGHRPDIETAWVPVGGVPTTAPAVASQPAASASAAPSSSATDPTLKAEIDKEHTTVAPYCQSNPTLGALLDCPCIADAVYAARLKGPTMVSHGAPTSHGPRIILEPQLGTLIESLDLRSCANKDKVDAYSVKRTTSTLGASVKEPRLSQLGACVAQRFNVQVASDPKALTNIGIIDNDFSSNLSYCNQKIR
jgi:hypothetical protein